MATLSKFDAEMIDSKISGFKAAWNNRDLGTLNAYLSKHIIVKHPSVHLGFINVVKGRHEGCFEVIRFWEEVFNDFNPHLDEVDINDIELLPLGYRVHCTGHYPHMEVSGSFFLDFDSSFLIERIEFTQVTNYRADLKVSSFGLAVKYFKVRSK